MTVKKIANAIRKASKDKGLCNTEYLHIVGGKNYNIYLTSTLKDNKGKVYGNIYNSMDNLYHLNVKSFNDKELVNRFNIIL